MSVIKRIFCDDRCSVVTGSRVLKRRPLNVIDVERGADDDPRPVILSFVQSSGNTTNVEMAESVAFELAVTILEKAISRDYVCRADEPETLADHLLRVAANAVATAEKVRKPRRGG
jgi:hypothetical protein